MGNDKIPGTEDRAGARSHLTYDLGEFYIGRRALSAAVTIWGTDTQVKMVLQVRRDRGLLMISASFTYDGGHILLQMIAEILSRPDDRPPRGPKSHPPAAAPYNPYGAPAAYPGYPGYSGYDPYGAPPAPYGAPPAPGYDAASYAAAYGGQAGAGYDAAAYAAYYGQQGAAPPPPPGAPPPPPPGAPPPPPPPGAP